MKLKSVIAAAAIATLPLAVQAAPLTGQLDLVGVVNLQGSQFMPSGSVDFIGSGLAIIATEDFAAFMGTAFDLFDIDFEMPDLVYSGGGLSFTATNYTGFDNASPGRGFSATGVLKLAGYDDTPGVFALSTQETNANQVRASFSSSTMPAPVPLPASVLMLLGALSGLGVISRQRKAAQA